MRIQRSSQPAIVCRLGNAKLVRVYETRRRHAGPPVVSLCRTTLLRWVLCSIWQLAGVPPMLTVAVPAAAQGKLEARYDVTLAGILVGTGAWTVDILDDQYSAAASGGATGLLKALAH